jgi:hypothetical protein
MIIANVDSWALYPLDLYRQRKDWSTLMDTIRVSVSKISRVGRAGKANAAVRPGFVTTVARVRNDQCLDVGIDRSRARSDRRNQLQQQDYGVVPAISCQKFIRLFLGKRAVADFGKYACIVSGLQSQ